MAASAWETFQQAGRPGTDVTSVRPQILHSWDRSRSNGIDPEGLDIRVAQVDLDTAFIRAGSRVLLSMADVLVGTQTSLALTDPYGNIAWRWEPERSLGRQMDRTEVFVGSSMGERLAGTNGIGVALAEQRTAIVIGDEHFKQPWHQWACAAAPVIHPVSGRTVGAVNIACRAHEANHLMLAMLRSLVTGVRGALEEAASARERRLMDAHLRHRATAQGPVVTLDDRNMIVNDDAAALGLDRATLWAMLRELPYADELPVHEQYVAVAHAVAEGRPGDGYSLVLHRRDDHTPANGIHLALSPLETSERQVILQALLRYQGNKSETASYLGVSRGTLYKRLRRYGL